MIRLATLLLALCISSAAYSAPAKQAPPQKLEPVKAFQELVATASEPKEWTRVYLNSKTQKWAKQYYSMSAVTYDVKKTDSLVTPVIGLTQFKISVRQSDLFDSQEDANATDSVSANPGLQYRVAGTYHLTETAWRLDNFEYENTQRIPGIGTLGSLTMTRERALIEANSALGSALQRWVR